MSYKRYKQLMSQSAAGTSDWLDMDVRYEAISVRPIQGTIANGDTIAVQVITKDVKGNDKSFLDSLAASDITTLKTYTGDFNDLIEGNWTYVRVVKTGANGTAVVEGFF